MDNVFNLFTAIVPATNAIQLSNAHVLALAIPAERILSKFKYSFNLLLHLSTEVLKLYNLIHFSEPLSG